MTIGIDARLYGPSRGIGRYLQKLISYLEQIDKTNQYVIFLTKENWDEYQPQNNNFKKVKANYRWYGWQEQIFLPLKIKLHKIDLMHFPHFNVPLFPLAKFVVTIHDLILFKHPTPRATTLSPLLFKLKYWAYKITIKRAIKKSEQVITVSEYSKKEILKNFRAPSEKISVIYEATEPPLDPIPNVNLKEYKITQPYLLYVGNAYPHKNLERLIEVFKTLNLEYNNRYQLVLAGKEDDFYKRLKNETKIINNDVVFLGFAGEETLANLYQQASLYVFPSLTEWFGLPALEAMSYELPVVASSSSCLQEILGDAAIYFDPESMEDMRLVIKEGLDDQKIRERLKHEGLKQVRKYSWGKCAEETLKIYMG